MNAKCCQCYSLTRPDNSLNVFVPVMIRDGVGVGGSLVFYRARRSAIILFASASRED
jgi:hypothetical protein